MRPSPLWLAAEGWKDQQDLQLQSDWLERIAQMRADFVADIDRLNSDERRDRWREAVEGLDGFIHDFLVPGLKEDE